jgi:hypothetical protein
MRISLLTLVPAIALAALPAFAQSSYSQSTTTTTTGAQPAPMENETMTKKVEKHEDSMSPSGESHQSKSYERQTTSDGYNASTKTHAAEHSVTTGPDGTTAETHSTTTQTGPQ